VADWANAEAAICSAADAHCRNKSPVCSKVIDVADAIEKFDVDFFELFLIHVKTILINQT